MIKVLHYIPGFLYGGIESLFLDWYKRIDHENIEFELLIRTQDDNAIALKQYREMNGKYHRLPKKSNMKEYIKKVNLFFNKHHDYDIVHCHGVDAFVLAAAKRYGIKTIVHSHTTKVDGSILKPKNLFFAIDSWIGKKCFADYGFACSQLAAEWMFGGMTFKRKKVVVIHNAIDTQKYKFIPELRANKRAEMGLGNSFSVGHVGRMTPPKNQFYLLDIFKEVVKLNSNSVLLMVGDGPDENALKEHAKKLGIYQHVRFLGKRSDVPELMQVMDLFLLPSRYEGLPVTLMEAQASGLPCVISDLITQESDITDLIIRESIESTPSVWAKVICGKLDFERSDVSDIIAKNGFDMDSETKKLIRLYQKICK